ncbi:MAG: hypothetical protein ACYS74_17355 [Planctomycetota bacterium]|jgi:hypothetical protein
MCNFNGVVSLGTLENDPQRRQAATNVICEIGVLVRDRWKETRGRQSGKKTHGESA